MAFEKNLKAKTKVFPSGSTVSTAQEATIGGRNKNKKPKTVENNKAKTGVNKYIIWIKTTEPMSSKQGKSEACNRRMRHGASQLTPPNESRLEKL